MLYITYDATGHQDGAGAQILRIISAYILSKYYKIGYIHTPIYAIGNYGLLCLEQKKEDKSQIERYNALFELPSDITLESIHEIISIQSIDDDTIKRYINMARSRHILLKVVYPIFGIDSNPNVLHESPSLPLKWPNRSNHPFIRIGIHIRRGDILLIEKEIRYLPNQYYIAIMRALSTILKEIPYEFHIYTENVTKPIHFTSDFRSDLSGVDTIIEPDTYHEFKEFNSIHWHINTDPIDSFIDLCKADILVTSISAYSYLAAIINKNAFVICPHINKPHPSKNTWHVMQNNLSLETHSHKIIEHCHTILQSYTPIRYCSGGALGDFIHQLSVIHETYLKTGRKGILYISHEARSSDHFPFGLEQAYRDTYDLISTQPYIESYYIHHSEECDINLSSWVINQPLYQTNWSTIFSNEYGVEWCNTPYLTIPYDDTYKECIFISSSIKRFNRSIDYHHIISMLPSRPIFITSIMSEYEYFKQTTGIELECVYLPELYKLYTAINSCLLFIGNLSSPLTIAQAVHKPRICILQADRNSNDNLHMTGLDTMWSDCFFLYDSNQNEELRKFITGIYHLK